MSFSIIDTMQYAGAALSTLAALIVSLNIGRRWTGLGFVLFVIGSICLIAWGFGQPDSKGIGWQNVALLCINCVGVHRYLISKHTPPY